MPPPETTATTHTTSGRAVAVLAALRPKQWIKNLLIFVPIVAAHEWRSTEKLANALLAFVGFSLCASAAYVLNDYRDVETDRTHPTKRFRPFASRRLPAHWAPGLCVLLLLAGAAASARLPWQFQTTLLFYVVATVAYSFSLKRIAMLDVIVLAGLYTSRIIAGGAATQIVVSEWLMALSLFFFTSLAFGKRYCELLEIAEFDPAVERGRGYLPGDVALLGVLGPTSGYLSILVFALYVNADAVRSLYPQPQYLWLVCPVLMYWISRYWLLAKRRMISEDPILYAIGDRVSLTAGALVLVCVLLASA